ncbi:type 1 fimbrial protein, partial [Escherichia coli]
MCTLLKRFLSISLCSISLFTLPAMAQQISTGGVIHFRGAIVESPCDVNARQQQIELSCMRDGTTRNSLYNQQQVATAPQNVQQIATVKMH